MMRSVFPEGAEGDRGVLIQVNGVTDGYFETLGIPVLRGRTFDATDRKGSVPVVIVNETMAAKFWPDQDALGKRFRFFGEDDMVEVVGVARDAKYNTLGEDPQSYIYRPLEQDYAGAVTLIASTEGEPAGILLPIQRELKELNREMPLVGISTVGQVLTNSLWASRLGASLLALFGGLALILATVGIYGVMSYVVSQRAQEIGVRMTLGADRGTVMRMVFRQGMLVVVAGLVLGLVLAAAATRVIGNLLFVSASDPLVYIAMSLTLAAVGALANLFPALRATAVDPLIALRSE
jgi:predicted permease